MKISQITICVLALVLCRITPVGAETGALDPVTPNFNPGAEYADDTRLFQGIPGIEIAANGRQWAVWYAGGQNEPGEGPGNYVALSTSIDGKKWSNLKVVIDPPGMVRAYDPVLWTDPKGRLWLFWAQSYNAWDGRSGTWAMVTEDGTAENVKWSAPRRLCDGIMMNKPTVTTKGEWFLPISVWPMKPIAAKFTRIPPDHAHDLGERIGAQVVVSKDEGKTFEYRGLTHSQEGQRTFDEHMIVERKDGSIWMLLRTRVGMAESFSTDDGKTWTPGVPAYIRNCDSRFFIRRLKSGNLLLVRHVSPNFKARSHLAAHVSKDDGKTWQGKLMLDERAAVSYPDGIQDKDGNIHIIYDYNRYSTKHILKAVFTEEDILAGKPSAQAQLQILVNQATGTKARPQQD